MFSRLLAPSLQRPVSQLCTAAQFAEPAYAEWRDRFGFGSSIHRKNWEWVFIAQALRLGGKLTPGMRGVGFGVGGEPLPRVFAEFGCTILATDQTPEAAAASGWGASAYAPRAEQGVAFRTLDMRDIAPARSNGPFDFAWSSCALEHLGSPKAGLDFVCATIDLLKPGGMAVHTTEFLTDEPETVAVSNTVLYAERDIRLLAKRLRRLGCAVRLNLRRGRAALDKHVDVPPYHPNLHIRLELERHITTSIGVIAVRSCGRYF